MFHNISDDDYCPSRNNFIDKEIDFGFPEENQLQQSFPVSPFVTSNRNSRMEKKLSQLINQCLTPKKAYPLGGSNVNQQTPVNPLNRYLDFKDQEPSPFGNNKFETGRNPFLNSMKSNINTPEIPNGRNTQNEDVFQRFVLPKMEDSLRKLLSSSKKKRKLNRNKNNMRQPPSSHFSRQFKKQKAPLLEDFHPLLDQNNIRDDEIFFKRNAKNLSFETPIYQKKERHKLKNRFGMNYEQDAQCISNNFRERGYMKEDSPYNPGKKDHIRNKNIIGPRRNDSKGLFHDLSRSSHISNQVHTFLESSYSKIMESETPRNQNHNKFGKLLASAINTMKDDRQVKGKSAPKSKILSDLQSFNNGPPGFPSGTT